MVSPTSKPVTFTAKVFVPATPVAGDATKAICDTLELSGRTVVVLVVVLVGGAPAA